MKSLSLIAVLVALVPWSSAVTYQRVYTSSGGQSGPLFSSSSSSSSSSSFSSSSSSHFLPPRISFSFSYNSCCNLNSWAIEHSDYLKEFANHLRQVYYRVSGSSSGQSNSVIPWSERIIKFTGKTSQELDDICRVQAEKLVKDKQSGLVTADVIAQAPFFEWKSSDILQNNVISDLGNVRTYNYPTETKVVNGKTIVVHQNQIEGDKITGDGTYENPYVKVVRRNRTILTTIPVYSTGYGTVEGDGEPDQFQPGYGSITTGTKIYRKYVNGKLVYESTRPFGSGPVPDWEREERENFIWFLNAPNNAPEDLKNWQAQQEKRLAALAQRYHSSLEEIKKWHREELERYTELLRRKPSQTTDKTVWGKIERSPLYWFIQQTGLTLDDLQRWLKQNTNQLITIAKQYQINLDDLIKWLIEQFKRLRPQHQQPQQPIDGSEGPNQSYPLPRDKLVTLPLPLPEFEQPREPIYNNQRPDNQLPFPRDGDWRREELANFIWFLNAGKLDPRDLENWERQQERRLLDLTQRYHCSLEEIREWYQVQLERYRKLLMQQPAPTNGETVWSKIERSPLYWLINQNGLTLDDLERWLKQNTNQLITIAKQYQINLDDLIKWLIEQFNRLRRHTNNTEYPVQQDQQPQLPTYGGEQPNQLYPVPGDGVNQVKPQQPNNIFQSIGNGIGSITKWVGGTVKNAITGITELAKKIADKLLNIFKINSGERLTEWQKKIREQLLVIIQQKQATPQDLELILRNPNYLNGWVVNFNVNINELKKWIETEISRLRGHNLVDPREPTEWQKILRQQIIILLQNNQLTVDEFVRKLLSDRKILDELRKKYNINIYEIQKWIEFEAKHLLDLGILQIQELPQNWQIEQRDYIIRLIEENNLSIDELRNKIRNDPTELRKISQRYQVDIEVITEWIEREIQKLQSEGFIESVKLRDWQVEWRNNLIKLIREAGFTVDKLKNWLQINRARWQNLATQYKITIEEIEQWILKEVQKLVYLNLFKPNKNSNGWQTIIQWLQSQIRQPLRLGGKYLHEVLQGLLKVGKVALNNLIDWKLAGRANIINLIKQHRDEWSNEEFVRQLKRNVAYLKELADKAHVDIKVVEEWIITEFLKIKNEVGNEIGKIPDWEVVLLQILQQIIKENNRLNYVQFELELQKRESIIQQVSWLFSVSVENVKQWLREQLLNLKTTGKLELIEPRQWQSDQVNHMIAWCLQQQTDVTIADFEQYLQANIVVIKQLAMEYNLSEEYITQWMRNMFQRLIKSGLIQVQKLSYWQKIEKENLEKWLKQQHRPVTGQEIQYFIDNNRDRLQRVVQNYNIPFETIIYWLQGEGARLQFLDTLSNSYEFLAIPVGEISKYTNAFGQPQRYIQNLPGGQQVLSGLTQKGISTLPSTFTYQNGVGQYVQGSKIISGGQQVLGGLIQQVQGSPGYSVVSAVPFGAGQLVQGSPVISGSSQVFGGGSSLGGGASFGSSSFVGGSSLGGGSSSFQFG